jgi:hypothetical protein
MFHGFKRKTLALALGGLLLSGAAMAQSPSNAYMHGPAMAGSMHGHKAGAGCHEPYAMWHHGMGSGMPLINMVQRHAFELKLTDKQASEIAVWRNHHLKESVDSHEALRKDFIALHEAALAGRDRADLERIATRIDHERAKLLAMGIDQVEFLRGVLTPEQWKQATDWAKRFEHFKMRTHGFMRSQMAD